jgi:signal transduction histidine kinase
MGTIAFGPFTLAPDQNHVEIQFFAIASGSGGPLRYRTRLDGGEPEWTTPSERRSVQYASLAPGRYRFLVEAVGPDGITSSTPAVVTFTILPPVWQRWWFLSLAALLGIGLTYTVHRARVGRLLALERMRARIAADLHDDLGGSLSRIAIQSEVARRDVVDATASAARLQEIGDTARDVVESLADVVWSVDPAEDHLASVERRLRQYAADVLGAAGTRWTFHGAAEFDRIALDPDARRDLWLLLKEGVTNIARHADARVASLHLSLVGRGLHAELRDDGRGFDTSADPAPRGMRSHGLANMRWRAERLGGSLVIDSRPGGGTCIRLAVPLQQRRRMNMRLWPIRRRATIR